MKLRVKRKNGRIIAVTLVSEDQADNEVLEALFHYDVSRERLIYRAGKAILQAKVSEFRRR